MRTNPTARFDLAPWALRAITPAWVLALAACGGVDAANALTGSKDSAEYMKAKMQLRAFADAIKAEELSSGEWPVSLDQMAVDGTIRPSDLKDPWGNDYIYAPPQGSDHPSLYSMGEDGKAGTPDDVIHEW